MIEIGLGWSPDPAEGNAADLLLDLGDMGASANTDLRYLSPPRMNQGSNGSCVFQTAAGLIYAAHKKQGVAAPELISRMMLWWLCRKERGLEDFNVGAWLRQAFRVAKSQGFCRERHMPHSRTVYDDVPPKIAEHFARDQNVKNAGRPVGGKPRPPVEYRRILAPKGPGLVLALRATLASHSQVGGGWDVPERFTKGRFDPAEPYTMKASEQKKGGHAMRFVASLDNGFLVENSWGPGWGDDGRFVMSNEEAGKTRDPWTVISAPYFSDGA